MSNGNGDHEEEGYVVKLRGLPWSTTVDEIMKFFSDCRICHGKAGIHMTMSREGRPSGEAYIEMETEEDIEKACKRDRDHMGHRYIEVFKARRSEMEWVVKRSGLNLENAMDDGCVRLRGLPFGCSKEEIAQFFSGLEILPNGISLPTDSYTGRSTGEAYVQFVNKDVAERALQKHKEKIGHRYIEIFRSSLSEVRASIGPKMRGGPMGGGFNQRPAPYDQRDRFGGMNRFNSNNRNARNRDFDGGPWGNSNNFGSRGGGMGMRNNMDMKGGNYRGNNDNWGGNSGIHCVHMRGLPFRATEQDIADFFRPLIPVNIRIILENNGRASGEADVEFATHEDAVKAMSKDKSHMSHRYIELFLNSSIGSGGMSLGGIGNFCGGLGNNFRPGYSPNNRGYNSQLGGNNYNSF
ncbi:heterogeneous nuclear ribonucleoprotein H2 [Chelonus insularis]|uniref:heterogeneous nuclear ribonucleoprotein H2 n=1 Tax=Chelonus insularis TaxID=460826 RepID=UPI0015899F59|nr:heterogeneous nuclear ribonucleoprotein H2 [Chelonus insularis]XP_034945144.1 heterogeneous nuclear ribonucleoprotein H2 [Chelonus insularis]XP_034945145.1 heterogeneous nuclear ribonucleoprotein H2 [Chelonus insularis]